MAIEYPSDLQSDFPVNVRKAIKLAQVIYDDWIEFENGTGENEWVPDLIHVVTEEADEEQNLKLMLRIDIDGVLLEAFFEDDNILTDSIMEWYEDDEVYDWEDNNLKKFIDIVETIIVDSRGSKDFVEFVYEEMMERIEDIDETVPVHSTPGVKKKVAKKKVVKKKVVKKE